MLSNLSVRQLESRDYFLNCYAAWHLLGEIFEQKHLLLTLTSEPCIQLTSDM